MANVERGVFQVVVPVGLLLSETHEMTVSVSRPGGDPLPVRLRFVPALPVEASDRPVSTSTPTPLRICRPKRALLEEGYGETA